MSSLDDIPPVPKVEQSDDEEFEDSSPEAEDHNLTQEVTQVQKRKGGRKPVSLLTIVRLLIAGS